jgi:hypothetical protein
MKAELHGALLERQSAMPYIADVKVQTIASEMPWLPFQVISVISQDSEFRRYTWAVILYNICIVCLA